MVTTTVIRTGNEHFASELHAGCVCVFAGATGGIGASTLERMTTMLCEPTFYILGRSAARFTSQHEKLKSLNPGCKVVFIEVEMSLLSDVDAACKRILMAEKKVDYLYMSAGLLPLNGPEFTKEGLETCFALSYYSRIYLTSKLLPLLSQSPHPRVLSVLNGGREKSLFEDDIGLEKNWSPFTVIKHTSTMTSLAFEYLAENHKQITFMHAFPGLVQTDIFAKLTPPESSGIIWRITLAALRSVAGVIMRLFGTSTEESGERQAYHLTSDYFGPGAWRIGESSDKITSPGVLGQYRERGWPEKIWDYTLRVFDNVSSSW